MCMTTKNQRRRHGNLQKRIPGNHEIGATGHNNKMLHTWHVAVGFPWKRMSTPPNRNSGVNHNKKHPCKACLIELLSYVNGTSYPPHHDFTAPCLCQITGKDIDSFLQKKAYGVAHPTPSDQHTRTWSLAVSHFIPEKRPLWDEIWGGGNRTKSDAFNEVISNIKIEVRGEGVASQARHPIKWEDFNSILIAIQIFYPDQELKDLMLSICNLQWQLIGRIDDVMKLDKSSLSFNH